MFKLEATIELLKKHGVQFKTGAVSLILNCPRCTKKKLYIRKSDGRSRCFKCASEGFYGKAEYILTEVLNTDVSLIKEIIYHTEEYRLREYVDFELKDAYSWDENEFLGEEELQLVDFKEEFVTLENDKFLPAFKYLVNRNININRIVEYNIKFDPITNRVIFPAYIDGDLVGWQGRYIYNTSKKDYKTGKMFEIPKYLTSQGLKKEQMLLFQDNLNNSKHAILTEGPISSLQTALCGGNVCSLGKSVSNRQLDIIKSKVSRLYLGLDPDAVFEIDKICHKLYGLIDLYLFMPPKGKEDLGAATEEENLEQFHKSERLCGQIFFDLKI